MAIQPKRSRKLLHKLLALDVSFGPPQVEAIPVACPRLPEEFQLARIAVVADVHLPDTLVNTDRLISCVAAQRPDAIFLPGDLTNSYTDFDAAGLKRLAVGLAAIAPCFAIPGNHEMRLEREPRYRAILEACGVRYMSDSYADWEKDGRTLRLYGMNERRPAPLEVENQPAIVLAHRPEYLEYYRRARWDLVVCGHAHGGQVRIPKICEQGLYAPHQGWFPKYTSGRFELKEGQTLIVSRGLSKFVRPRVFNKPELVLITVEPK